jgi:coniferyl-aldehyde dehydrogenase
MSTLPTNQLRTYAEPAAPEFEPTFELQRRAFRRAAPDYTQRLHSLKLLERALIEGQSEIVAAVSEDFGGRARQETLLLELAPLVDSIRHARRHLANWMKPRKVLTGLNFFPAKSRIINQPLGVIGIIGAWNYPVFLTLSPLVDAIAAGNHAMLKPSELAPHTAELLRKIIAAIFPEEFVAVVTGDSQAAAQFASLPFDHLIFTGSTRVGKLIMRAASENLTPVTLELGGKSPVIVHREYPLRTAAERILTGKLYNAGQTCLAPDYVFVHESQQDAFVQLAKEVTQSFYPRWTDNADYTRIINSSHYERLIHFIKDAEMRGARVAPLGENTEGCDSQSRVFPAVVVLDVSDAMLVMQEEIFGPILPVLTYKTVDEALKYVNERPHPLALYYFDNDRRRVDEVVRSTISGGVTINDVIYHVAQNNLPFGGVGPSGMGSYHGKTGFDTFSLKKAVFLQSRFSTLRFLRPPYGPLSERMIRFLLRK